MKFFEQNRAKTIAAGTLLVLAAACQIYLIQKQVTYINGLLELRDKFAGLGNLLGGLGSGSLGSAMTIPATFYVSLTMPIVAAALLILIFAKLALPVGSHRFVLLGMLAVYVLQAGFTLLNARMLQNSDSVIINIMFKPAPITARTILFMMLTPYLVLLAGLIVQKGADWFRAGAAAVSLAAAAENLYRGIAAGAEGRDNVGMALSILAPACIAAAILLHPVLQETMYLRPWDRDGAKKTDNKAR